MSNSVLTITMNPSVDISYPLEHLKIDTVNRVKEVSKTAGGKGLNVTRVLKQLDVPVTASGIIGGTIGQYILNQLDEKKVDHAFMKINQESRNCIAILHDGGDQTEILESGPSLTEDDENNFLEHFEEQVSEFSLVTISGSLPQGLSTALYTKMVKVAAKHNVPVILDSSNEALRLALEADVKPFMIKPNQDEIAQLIGKEVEDLDDLKEKLATEEIFQDIPWVVVSLGSKGCFVKHIDKFFKVNIPKIHAINPVGSGDSTVAGLAAGIVKHESPEDVMKRAMTVGILNTLQEKTGFIDINQYKDYFEKVNVVNY
ncbi:hexose kinase [Companilactobacillus allii]|uniref:Tagatose-6-phosphate kinase n=1 Tax=Companilactobacillus allii TaxID=1847728 RepID=A0A1P8Q1J2_9LACO|nr:hexose kinase [Companilactobacillus allii]APX71691.1 tagatose-6-phosphate kinase [Companilactobacillus allii]USQ68779.1 hexose kinase [Companilactobacillus allii]